MFESLRRKVDLDAPREEKAARLRQLAESMNLDVKFSAGFSTVAQFDGQEVRIVHPDFMVDEYGLTASEAEVAAMYLLLHELGHAKFSRRDVQTYMDRVRDNVERLGYEWDKFFTCLDACEDVTVDKAMALFRRGAKDYHRKGLRAIGKYIAKKGPVDPIRKGVYELVSGEKYPGPVQPFLQQDDVTDLLRTCAEKNHTLNPIIRDTEKYAMRLYKLVFGEPDPTSKSKQNQGQGDGDGDESGEQSKQKKSSNSGEKTRTVKQDRGENKEHNGSESESGEGSDEGENGEGEENDTQEGESGSGDAEGEEEGEQGEGDGENAPQGEGDDTEPEMSGEEVDNQTQEGTQSKGGKAKINVGQPLTLDMDAYRKCEQTYGAKSGEQEIGKDSQIDKAISYPYQNAPWIKGAKHLYKQGETLNDKAVGLNVRAVKATEQARFRGKTARVENRETDACTADLTRRLKRIVEQETMAISQNHRMGLLDVSRLPRVASHDARVFKQRDEKSEGGVAVHIVLDASGSMGSSTLDVAKLCVILSRAMEANKVAVKISTHNTDALNNAVRLVTLKDWDDHGYAGLDSYVAGADNRDDVAMYLSGLELLTRPEERKLLVMFSDGQPADGTSRNSKGQLSDVGGKNGIIMCKQAIQKLRRSGVRVVGVYWDHRGSRSLAKAMVVGTKPMTREERDKLSWGEQREYEMAQTQYVKYGVFKEMYGDDFMVCPADAWKEFPARIMRALSNVFRR